MLDIQFDEQGQAYDVIVRDANPAQDRIDGVRAIIGKRVREIMPDIEMKWIERYAQVARSGEAHHFEDWSEANQRWYEVHASRVGEAGSSLVAIVYNEITERKRAAQALQLANRRKDEFLAMLAHELRNPMATLHNTLLVLQLTRGDDPSLPLDKAVELMSQEVGHLTRMVDDLLDVGRISQGKITLQKKRLDFTRLVSEALEAASPEFTRCKHVLLPELADGPVWVDGDNTRLTQVVRNLLTNAAKYTPNGGQITVRMSQENRQVVLSVRDTGIGLAADQLEAIFEIFVQISSSLDRPQGGLGLGLAVVKQLVELHGGSVAATSPGLGQGSEFIVRLPTLADLPPAARQTGGTGRSSSGRPIVLVVDDKADLAMVTGLLLRHLKYEAHTCLSGLEALEAVERLQPDAVLLDLGMPGMDGFATCSQLRSLPWGQHGVIIALSGYGQPEDLRRTQAAGFDGHLVKPVNLGVLSDLLTRLLTPAS